MAGDSPRPRRRRVSPLARSGRIEARMKVLIFDTQPTLKGRIPGRRNAPGVMIVDASLAADHFVTAVTRAKVIAKARPETP